MASSKVSFGSYWSAHVWGSGPAAARHDERRIREDEQGEDGRADSDSHGVLSCSEGRVQTGHWASNGGGRGVRERASGREPATWIRALLYTSTATAGVKHPPASWHGLGQGGMRGPPFSPNSHFSLTTIKPCADTIRIERSAIIADANSDGKPMGRRSHDYPIPRQDPDLRGLW